MKSWVPSRTVRYRRPAGTRWWHRTDPRARLLFTLVLSGAVLAADSRRDLILCATTIALLHLSSRTGPAAAWAALRPFRFLLLFTAALQLVFTGGASVSAAGLPLRVAGAAAAGLTLLRLGGLILASSHLMLTTSPLDLSRCLGWAIGPGKALGLPVRDVEMVMAIGAQFLPVLLDESRTTRAALESRGISLRHPRPRFRARALLAWLLALLGGMGERSARLAVAMEAKGFCLRDRTRRRFPPWNPASTLLLAAGAALIATDLFLA